MVLHPKAIQVLLCIKEDAVFEAADVPRKGAVDEAAQGRCDPFDEYFSNSRPRAFPDLGCQSDRPDHAKQPKCARSGGLKRRQS